MNKLILAILLISNCIVIHAQPRIDIVKPFLQRKIMDLKNKHCIPCEGGIPPLNNEQEDALLKLVPEWSLEKDGIHKIVRNYRFKDFIQAMDFVNKVATLAEEQGHHPAITIHYNKVTLEFYTFAIKGLSENDFIMASKVNELAA